MEEKITDCVRYIGVDDVTLDLFEGQYRVPNGISYNSYVILDEKIAVMDTVDPRGIREWEERLLETLDGRKADYLVIHHMEPDHAGALERFLELFPEAVLVGNAKTFAMMEQFFEAGEKVNSKKNRLVVCEGDRLVLGRCVLTFYMAPMVHWPEVMVSYECSGKVLFSADAFGRFGALSLTAHEGWACEARRYYFNIVGKYGRHVQALLQKMSVLELEYICPLHGPVIRENLAAFVHLYDIWSSYEPEGRGVLIACASFHGNTWKAATCMREQLRALGVVKVVLADLARCDMAEVIEDAFRYDRMILAAPSYDCGVAPSMEDFLHHLWNKNYQKRRVGILENGSWSPCAAKKMRELLDRMQEITIVEPVVTICSTMKPCDEENIRALALAMCDVHEKK